MTLAALLERGVHLQRYEALAIARDLIARGEGVPTIDNVQLASDGSAACIDTTGTPEVSHVADLLQALLPSGPAQVPAPLRYTLARGLRAVEAPPFESLAAFSESLARFEAGDRHGTIRALLQRAAPPEVPEPQPQPQPQPLPLPLPLMRVRSQPPQPQPEPQGDAPVASAVPPPAATPHRATASTPSRRGAVGPRPALARWRPILAAIAASFVLGAIGARSTLRQSPPTMASAGPQATPPPAAPQPAPTDVPAPRDTEWPVPTSGTSAVPPAAFSPAFAANGAAMFFHTGGARDATSAIAMTHSSGDLAGAQRVVTVVDDGARNYHPRPSPDGRLIAFDSDRDGVRGVYIANADGTQARRISPYGYAAAPTWSPDGKRLAYLRAERARPHVWNLWVQTIDDQRATRVTAYSFGQTWSASWFPDNRRICYTHDDKVVVGDLSSGETRQFASPVAGRVVRTPAVSPDGSKVVFQVFRNGAWLLDLANGSMRRILADPIAEEFAWAPDGQRIAFHSRRGGAWSIFFMTPR